MDTVYVVAPYWNRVSTADGPPRDDMGGMVYDPENLEASGMPRMDKLLNMYTQMTRWDPRSDRWEIAKLFHLMRGGTISHGIQAGAISGQASSDFSQVYFQNTRRSLDAALVKVRELKAVIFLDWVNLGSPWWSYILVGLDPVNLID